MGKPRIDQALYSVGDLAKLIGWNRHRTRRLLLRHGLIEATDGKKAYVTLVDLQRGIPKVWDSVVLRHALRG